MFEDSLGLEQFSDQCAEVGLPSSTQQPESDQRLEDQRKAQVRLQYEKGCPERLYHRQDEQGYQHE